MLRPLLRILICVLLCTGQPCTAQSVLPQLRAGRTPKASLDTFPEELAEPSLAREGIQEGASPSVASVDVATEGLAEPFLSTKGTPLEGAETRLQLIPGSFRHATSSKIRQFAGL